MQIWQYNVRHTNIIVMKNMIAVAKKSKENKELLAIKNVDKTIIAEIVKMLNTIDLGNKYS